MPESPLLLAVDGGTQSTKVLLVDAGGTVHARGRALLRPLRRGDHGEAEHPDDDLWTSLVRAVRDLLAAWDGDTDRVAAIGLCSIRCCQVVTDAAGELLAPVRSWMDVRTWTPWAEDPLVHDPRVATVAAASAHLTRRLTGERVDAAAAYDSAWLGANRLPESLLPRTVGAGEVLGALTAGAAEALGLPTGVPVVATGNDKAVEALGAGLVEPGDGLLLSLGTYVAAMTPVRRGSALERAADAGGATWLNDACPPGTRLAETGGVRHGMGTVTWVADLVGDGVDRIAEEARAVPAGAGGLVCVPDWLAPTDQSWRAGALLGLRPDHGRAHVLRAVAEGLLTTMGDHVAATERDLGAPGGAGLGPFVLTGGGARSDLLTDIAAAVLDRAVVRPVERDAAGLGAAVCAAVGAGLHRDLGEAAAAMVRHEEPRPPDPGLVEAYAALAARHRTVREGTAHVLRDAQAREDGHG